MKSVLIIGMGTLGRSLAKKMQEMGNEILILDKHEETIQELSSIFPDAMTGDARASGVLRSVGVNNFDYCFVTIGEDFYAVLEITSILKELGAKCVIAQAKRARQADILKKLGADEVFFPEDEISEKLAVRYNSVNIFDYVEMTSECSIFEISVLPEWAGKTIMDLNVRQDYKINIIAIKTGEKLNPLPGGHDVLHADDHIVVIGRSSDVFKLTALMPED